MDSTYKLLINNADENECGIRPLDTVFTIKNKLPTTYTKPKLIYCVVSKLGFGKRSLFV